MKSKILIKILNSKQPLKFKSYFFDNTIKKPIFLAKSYLRNFSTESKPPISNIKDFYLHRKFAKSINPIIISFEDQILDLKSPYELSNVIRNLIPMKNQTNPIEAFIECFTLILIEKILIFQKEESELDLKEVFDSFYSLINTYLENYNKEAFLLYLNIVARDGKFSTKFFRIFQFVIMRTGFIKSLNNEEIVQLIEYCDKFYNDKSVEEDSFVETLEQIEKNIYERRLDFKISPELIQKIAFIYSCHRIGGQEFYQIIYEFLRENYEIMKIEELIIIGWSLINAKFGENKIEIFNKEIKNIININEEKIGLYFKNLYWYALEKEKNINKKFWKN